MGDGLPETVSGCIFPVILAVSETGGFRKGREQVEFLSGYARRAAALSAERIGASLSAFPKDKEGRPLPLGGIHWSLSHKPGFVGGVAAAAPVGLDIEKIRPCSEALLDKIAGKAEWVMAGGRSRDVFFRFWTAKEAVLKATGAGIKGLSHCRIVHVDDAVRLSATYREDRWTVEHFFFKGHTAAVATRGADVHWTLLPAS